MNDNGQLRKTLLVTNDFPPRVGGIQTYLKNYVDRLAPDNIVVYASTEKLFDHDSKTAQFDSNAPYKIYRYGGTVMLPTPGVKAQMQRIIRDEGIHTVWFGAAAPLGILANAARQAGAVRILATTHGHEVGWSMIPVASYILKKIFAASDVVSYISNYTLQRLSPSIGNTDTVRLPSGIDTETFRPDSQARAHIRSALGIGDDPMVLCLSRLVRRKGQDVLIEVWPEIVRHFPNAKLVIVGDGPLRRALERARQRSIAKDSIILTGKVPFSDLPAYHAAADLFAMPCRTRGNGLDVEGLGIVYLEASACGTPVIAGDSGGAPETVIEGETGWVVPGRDRKALIRTILEVLETPEAAHEMGLKGREFAQSSWTWPVLVECLQKALNGD